MEVMGERMGVEVVVVVMVGLDSGKSTIERWGSGTVSARTALKREWEGWKEWMWSWDVDESTSRNGGV